MWAGGTVEEHGLCAGDGEVECSYFGLSVFEGDAAAVDAAGEGCAWCVGG